MWRLGFVGLCACVTTEVAPPPRNVGPAPVVREAPDLDGFRVLVAKFSRYTFDEAAVARGCTAGEALGDYVSRLWQYGSPMPDGDVHKLTGGCGPFPKEPAPIDPPADSGYWYCVIDSYTSDPAGESPWHYELRARVRKADHHLDLATMSCPGTP